LAGSSKVARRKTKGIALRRDAEAKDDAIDLGEVTDHVLLPKISPPQASRPRDDRKLPQTRFVSSVRRFVRRLEANAAEERA